MAEPNATAELDGEKKMPDENSTVPAAPENTDINGNGNTGEQPEQSQTGTLEQDKYNVIQALEIPAPENPDIPSAPENTNGTEKQAVGQDDQEQENHGEDKLRKEQEALLKTLDGKANDYEKKNPNAKTQSNTKTDNSGKKPETGKTGKPPEKLQQGAKPPNVTKDDKKTAHAGGGGANGKSGQSAGKENKPPAVPESPIPEPPKDATRPGKTETIVYIDHAELHMFKDHPFKIREVICYRGYELRTLYNIRRHKHLRHKWTDATLSKGA